MLGASGSGLGTRRIHPTPFDAEERRAVLLNLAMLESLRFVQS